MRAAGLLFGVPPLLCYAMWLARRIADLVFWIRAGEWPAREWPSRGVYGRWR